MAFLTEKYDNDISKGTTPPNKFYALAKEHFQITVRNDYDFLNSVKESIRFFSLDLPQEIAETNPASPAM